MNGLIYKFPVSESLTTLTDVEVPIPTERFGVIFNEILGISFVSLGLSVGLTITLMMYFKVIHPPAAANPLIALFADVSVNYILFPVIAGSVSIIILSIVLNRYLLKRNYPKRWF